VHFDGTISGMVPSSSEVYVAYPGERPWVVARERLFEVVARRSTRVGDDEMTI
jgi:hypothetical protein